jgi:putative hemolysin
VSGVYYNLTLAVLLLVLALAAYVDRVYSEMGKFLAREYQDNIDAWTHAVEPGLWLGRETIALSASVLRLLTLAAIALIAGLRLYVHVKAQPLLARVPTVEEIAVTGFFLVLLILFFDRLIPQLLFARTRGLWIAHIRLLLEALFYLILPVTLTLGLLLSIVALAEPEDAEEEEHPSEAMDALLEAGEEEGILEESDRELVRSAVEFGDKVVREVMTPRPEIFAVPETLTLKDLLEMLKENSFSRVPVFVGSLDHVTGIVFARDLLHVLDADLAQPDGGGVAAAHGVCARDEEGGRAAARDAAGEAAHAHRDRRVRRRGRAGDDRGPAGGDCGLDRGRT